jgi:hypothetical protein
MRSETIGTVSIFASSTIKVAHFAANETVPFLSTIADHRFAAVPGWCPQKSRQSPIIGCTKHLFLMGMLALAWCFAVRAMAAEQQQPIKILSPAQRDCYSKLLDCDGIPIRAHKDVADEALREACRRLSMILEKQPNVHWNLKMAGAEVHILGRNQKTSDLPESRAAEAEDAAANQVVDKQAQAPADPIALCREESLLSRDNDRSRDNKTCIGEFAKIIFDRGVAEAVRDAFKKQHDRSLEKGLWKSDSAATDPKKFFAGLSAWYWSGDGDLAMEGAKPNNSREGLKQYDPEAFALIDDFYSGRIIVPKLNYSELYPLRPEREWQMTSTRPGGKTTIRFVNRGAALLKVFFLDLNGTRQPFGDLPAYCSLTMPTQAAHSWVVTDAQGNAQAIFVGETKQGVALVGPPDETKMPAALPPRQPKPLVEKPDANVPPIIALSPPQQDFYSKMIDFDGIYIKAPKEVSDEALREAYRRMSRQMAGQPNVHWNLKMAGSELHIIGRDQVTSDMPEYRRMKGRRMDGNLTVDERTRGMGGLVASCGEENLMLLDKDRYRGRDICVHEFGHNIFTSGIPASIRERIVKQYNDSQKNGHWLGDYAGTNPNEFFAELTMWYWGTRGELAMQGPKPEDGREGLKNYDPKAFALMDDFYTGRLAVPKSDIAELKPIEPEQESQLRSDKPGTDTSIRFLNRGNRPLDIFWLDADGKRQSSGKVPPYSRLSKSTQAGHAWLVADEQGKGLAIFVAEAKRGVAEVGLEK